MRRLRLALACMLSAAILTACDTNSNKPAPTVSPTTDVTTIIVAPTDTAAPTVAPSDTPALPTNTVPPLPPTDTPLQQALNPSPTANNATAGGSPSAIPTPSGTVVDTATQTTLQPTPADTVPSPTAVTATSQGQPVTALTALATLKQKALAAFPDARLAMLAESRPGQEKLLLSSSLGDPAISENTPGGKGRNWTLVAVSPSTGGAMAFSMDGTTVDLVKEGQVSKDVLAQFAAPNLTALDLSKLDPAALKDSDTVVQEAGERGKAESIGIALIAPDALLGGPLPTPTTGGNSPQLAYELYSTDPAKQLFIFFDAQTGKIVLDSGS